MDRMRATMAAAVLAAASLVSTTAFAQEWPSRPVRIVNPFPGAGATDTLARILADHFATAFKQSFFVEARGGAGGQIALKGIADTPHDTHTLIISTVSLLAVQPTANPKLGFDPHRDIANIAYVAGTPLVFCVNPSLGVKTPDEFVAHARNSAKPLSYSSSGVGTMGHLVAESFAQRLNVKFEHVPYKGAAQGLTDLAGGHIVFSAQTVSSSAGLIQGGALRAVVVSSNTRLPDYPDLPTFKEAGYSEMTANTWFALSGAASLPDDLVQKINREVVRAMAQPQVQQALRTQGFTTEGLTPAEFRTLIASETARWKPVIEAAGLVGQQ
jgi:tripartite-type tricarboxylate transporter receptor subunit TctC